MNLGCVAAVCLHDGTLIELVGSFPLSKSVKHTGYKNTTRDTKISTQQLCKCLVLAKWESFNLNQWCCKNQTCKRFNRKTHGFRLHIWNNLPQDIRHSLFLQKQTQDISLLRIFQLSNIVLHPYQSV